VNSLTRSRRCRPEPPIASLGDTFVAVEDVVEGDPICQEFDGL
jgi:hypothetical protein